LSAISRFETPPPKEMGIYAVSMILTSVSSAVGGELNELDMSKTTNSSASKLENRDTVLTGSPTYTGSLNAFVFTASSPISEITGINLGEFTYTPEIELICGSTLESIFLDYS
jgi:hypothetical protein